MQIDVDFPGGARVDAHFNGYTVHTDQTLRDGGQASAPSPFDLFLASTTSADDSPDASRIHDCPASACNRDLQAWRDSNAARAILKRVLAEKKGAPATVRLESQTGQFTFRRAVP